MARLWLPESAETATREAEGRDEIRRVSEFTERLEAVDPRLDCFLQTEDRDELRRGFYYVRRRNDNGTVATWEVSNPDGSFREPDERVIEALRASDSWSRDVWAEIDRERERAAQRMKRETDRRQESMRDQLKDEADYAFRTQFRPGDTRRLRIGK